MLVYHINDNLFDFATRQPLNRSATKHNPERHLLVTSIKELHVFVLLNIHFRPQGCLWNHNKAQIPFNVLRLILVLFLAAHVSEGGECRRKQRYCPRLEIKGSVASPSPISS